MSTGFVSKSEHPTSTLLARSLASAWAVRAMIGMAVVAGRAFMSCVASHPSMAPNATSIRIKSGISVAAMATLAMGEGAEGTPVALVRGCERWVTEEDGPGAASGLRPVEQDMFR